MAARGTNDRDDFKSWLSGGSRPRGASAGGVVAGWLDPFLTVDEQDGLLGWYLVVSL